MQSGQGDPTISAIGQTLNPGDPGYDEAMAAFKAGLEDAAAAKAATAQAEAQTSGEGM